MKIEAQTQTYKPRPGSSSSKAVQALLDGPMPAKALGNVMGVPPENVNANLNGAINGHVIVKVQDESGLLHYALPGMELDDRFKPYVNARRDVDPSDPFGLVAKAAAAPKGGQCGNTLAALQELNDDSTGTRNAGAGLSSVGFKGTTSPIHIGAGDNDGFIAGLMVTGELAIPVGSAMVSLNQERQLQIFHLLSRVKW